MIRPIMKDPIFLAQKSAPATVMDLPVAQDLRDTLIAHRDGCVGMAANMIGVAKRIIIFDDNGSATVMFNPEIVKCSGAYEAEEGCLSLPLDQGAVPERAVSDASQNLHRLYGADHPARDRPLQRNLDLICRTQKTVATPNNKKTGRLEPSMI